MVAETEEIELSVAEAAGFAGVSDRTIRNWINEGDLPATNSPQGRKVRKADVVEILRKKGYAPPELETIVNLADARAEREQRVAHEAEPWPEDLGRDFPGEKDPQLTPELINVILQPLVKQLDQERARADRKERENLELAGRIGYLQAKVQQYEERVLLLEAPKDAGAALAPTDAPQSPPDALPLTRPPMAASDDPPAKLPWYKRLFGAE